MTNQLPEQFKGSISEGTLNSRDLIPTYVGVIAFADPKHDLVLEWRAVEEAIKTLADWFQITPPEMAGTIDVWDNEYTSHFMESLFETLCEIAPEGTYFGAAEGDGASLGFWDDPDTESEVCGVCGRRTPLGDQSQPGDPAWDGYCSAECRERDAANARS
jgi:hypothetical protein